ncbi:dinuclear metal center protein, YbgI/SA1388 family [Arachidicoccus rhizosphaerae]|uniref:GTP cyclohydrolase 1 type 2 homolog n=1 Tax=Arachidicoccus rhizosphaerae TaxID=551991 RepID=A0A1H3VLD1_9BACT|nr:Nif3-like dinuclear metal center hexameric protein [Arachidicoccus rhizosphaerae]SDZ75585.1 dinuclear metal center protein, YbgI/SA1388 family [Arachidicoccus rhizosphaerae]
MQIQDVISILEKVAPAAYQESYDNAGLITGSPAWACKGILISLDCLEGTIEEAVKKGCNLVVAHHPILFKGTRQLTGKDYIQRTLIKAIKADVAIYAIHTNLDNVAGGVSKKMADLLGLINPRILDPKSGLLSSLVTFVPQQNADAVRKALFAAGAGSIGPYDDCAFSVTGTGTFKPQQGATPAIGHVGATEQVTEQRIELIFPNHLQGKLIQALIKAHPYEQVAYYIHPLVNKDQDVGSGMIGELPQPADYQEVLAKIKEVFQVPVIRHTPLLDKKVQKIALCGGAGSFLTKTAIAAGADLYLTADVKYHEFFDADGQIVLMDIGHFESEQYTIELLFDILAQKFPTFAILKSVYYTNPVLYYI